MYETTFCALKGLGRNRIFTSDLLYNIRRGTNLQQIKRNKWVCGLVALTTTHGRVLRPADKETQFFVLANKRCIVVLTYMLPSH